MNTPVPNHPTKTDNRYKRVKTTSPRVRPHGATIKSRSSPLARGGLCASVRARRDKRASIVMRDVAVADPGPQASPSMPPRCNRRGERLPHSRWSYAPLGAFTNNPHTPHDASAVKYFDAVLSIAITACGAAVVIGSGGSGTARPPGERNELHSAARASGGVLNPSLSRGRWLGRGTTVVSRL